MTRRFAVAGAVALFGVVACGGGTSDDNNGGSSGTASSSGSAPSGGTGPTAGYIMLDVDKLCDLAVNQCKDDAGTMLTLDQCKEDYGLLRVSPACKTALDTATCTTTTDMVFPTCFPTCSPTSPACDGSNISACVGGKSLVYDCVAVCVKAGAKFTGTCGKTFAGATSIDDRCFCQ